MSEWWQEDLDDGMIGPYRIERCIGKGGMAEVFLARPTFGELRGREVAIKVPRSDGWVAPKVLGKL